jgi:ubiquitin-activating enzyme E1
MEFIVAAANLHAFNYGLKGETDYNLVRKVADSVQIPPFVPKSGIKVQISDSDPVAESSGGAFHLWNRDFH